MAGDLQWTRSFVCLTFLLAFRRVSAESEENADEVSESPFCRLLAKRADNKQPVGQANERQDMHAHCTGAVGSSWRHDSRIAISARSGHFARRQSERRAIHCVSEPLGTSSAATSSRAPLGGVKEMPTTVVVASAARPVRPGGVFAVCAQTPSLAAC